jgi:hypothetical protein
MKYLVLTAFFVLALAGYAMAADTGSDTATASVTIDAWITVDAGADLDFGAVDPSDDTDPVMDSNVIDVNTNNGAWTGTVTVTGGNFLSTWTMDVDLGTGDQQIWPSGTANFSGSGSADVDADYTLGGFALADPAAAYNATVTVYVSLT